jgi:hypothetical protein
MGLRVWKNLRYAIPNCVPTAALRSLPDRQVMMGSQRKMS